MAIVSDWNEVTTFSPCKICGRPNWCSASADGTWAVCRRVDTGDGLHKIDKSGGDYWLYRVGGDDVGGGLRNDDCNVIIPLSASTPALADPDTLDKVYRSLLQDLTLSAAHRENLRERGLNDEEINLRGYKTLTKETKRSEIAKNLVARFDAETCKKVPGIFLKQGNRNAYWTLAGAAGIIIPVRDMQGRVVALKSRLDSPGKDGPKYTYITSAKRDGAAQDGPGPMPTVHLPVWKDSYCTALAPLHTRPEDHAEANHGKLSMIVGTVQVGEPSSGAIPGNCQPSQGVVPTPRVRLTEGELKADISTVLSSILTIAIPGVSAWRLALPVLRELAPEKIALAFDADARKNYNVARALQNTAVALQTEGFDVELETWSSEWGKGIDDILANGYSPYVTSGVDLVSATINKIAVDALAAQLKEQEAKKQQAKSQNHYNQNDQNNQDNERNFVRRAINADYQDLVYQKRACWEALEQHAKQSNPSKQSAPPSPLVFARSGSLVRIKHTVDEGYIIDVLRIDSLRNIIAEITRWYKADKQGNERSVFPVLDTIKGMLSESTPPAPRLRRIVQAPVFSADGTLITTPGYHEMSQTWYDKTCDISEVPQKPSKTEIQTAKDLFFNDLFVDFPFTDELSGVYAVAATILPFCRQMIGGATPLHLIDAKSGSGTGKSLLADLIAIPAMGHPSPGMAEGQCSDEWRKRITAKLIAGSQFFLIDNVSQKLDSGELAAAVTLAKWEDRVLGESKTIILPVECVWMATGNSVKTSREIARRLVRINLDAKVEDPWARTGFKHKSIREWATENRGRLIWAALMLVQAWIAEGKPQGSQVLGMFESWAKTLGGILDVAGIPGFLTNLREMHRESDEETEAWQEFLNVWWEKFGGTMIVVTTGMLHGLAIEHDLLLPILGSGSERAQKTVLGSALGKLVGRKLGGYEIREAPPDKRQRTKRFMLQKYGDSGGDSGDNGGDGGERRSALYGPDDDRNYDRDDDVPY